VSGRDSDREGAAGAPGASPRKPASIVDPVFDEPREQPGFRALRARIGRHAGAERLGASLWVLAPGQAAYPYHYHLGEEELVIVLEGELTLRTPEGRRELSAGEVVAFPRGEGGGHQLVNAGERPARFLALSTNGDPDVVVYPDSGKVGCGERRPDGSGMWTLHRLADTVDYYDGERPPEAAG
jgi:uncharacterized cupin superfamily protein